MNLRLPIALAVVAVAAGAAALHAARHDPPPFATTAPPAAGTPPPDPPHPARIRPLEPAARVTVYVAGDVSRPGVYALPTGSRAVDALHAAGGAAPDADPLAVNLAEPLQDGQEIIVPVKGSAAATEADAAANSEDPATPSTAQRHRAKRHRKHRKHRSHHHTESPSAAADASTVDSSAATDPSVEAPTQTIDLNTADENELETLPGIGASLASRIVTFRQINGPFASPDDLLDVGGMTQSRLDTITPYITTH